MSCQKDDGSTEPDVVPQQDEAPLSSPKNSQNNSGTGTEGSANGGSDAQQAVLEQATIEFTAMADVNADARADLVHFTDQGVVVALANGQGFLQPSLWTTEFAWGEQDRFPRLMGDVNGDGQADIVGFSRYGVVVAFSRQDHFAQSVESARDFGLESTSGSWASQNRHPRMLGYVNQDAYIDIVGCRAAGCYVALSTGNGFQSPDPEPWIADFSTDRDGRTSEQGWTSMNRFPRFLADVDGDGQSDIVGCGERGTWVSFADGLEFLPKGLNNNPDLAHLNQFGTEQQWETQEETPRLIGDIDGDGQADLLGFTADGRVRLALGETNLTASEIYADRDLAEFIEVNAIAGTSLQEVPRFLADVNGDGQDELVFLTKLQSLQDPGVFFKQIL
jgi:hypothetical protein